MGMIWPPLTEGILKKRYKRFLADIILKDKEITVHCPNPGRLTGVLMEGAPVLLSRSLNPARRLPYTWEMVQIQGQWIGVNTMNPNPLVYEALQKGLIPELASYKIFQREIKYGKNSRIDFLLSGGEDPRPCYLEVKNVHWAIGDQAFFPDSPTVRGLKHLQDLTAVCQQGARAMVLYIVQRQDCVSVSLAENIDPLYSVAAAQAQSNGVEMLGYDCVLTPQELRLNHRLIYKGTSLC